MRQFAPLKARKILVVDDEVLIRMALVDFLDRHDLEVLEAGDADEAIALLDSHSDIEVMVTDVEMPGSMDGVRLAHHVRFRWPPIKILVISGNAALEWRDLPDKTRFLRKPFADGELWNALTQLTA